MFYSYALMPRYSERTDIEEIERKPYWCVVVEQGNGNREYLEGPGNEFLKRSEAKERAEGMDEKSLAHSASSLV